MLENADIETLLGRKELQIAAMQKHIDALLQEIRELKAAAQQGQSDG